MSTFHPLTSKQYKMSITPQKKEFLCYIAGGLSTLMNCSMIADEIYTSYDDDIELYIRDHILHGSSFSENRFCKAIKTIDDGTLAELLTYFDSRDMSLARVYNECCIDQSDFPEDLKGYAECVEFGVLNTFTHFLEEP